MKKVIVTLVFGLFFVAFANAQSTETKKAKEEYAVSKETVKSSKKAKACCPSKKATSCDTKKAKSCDTKSKASCDSKKAKSCDTKKKSCHTEKKA